MLINLKKSIQDSRLKKYKKIVENINALEAKYEQLSDQALLDQTNLFKDQLDNGIKLESLKAEVFAVVREAAKRVLGQRHYDVQLIGGLVLSEGNIAEMATGEGKTLVASLPSYLRALEGKGVHVITVNDYLARRDYEQIGQIHKFLGLTVGLNLPMMEQGEKVKAYQADITYGVGTEFGFDFLRDNMVNNLSDRVQRPYHFAIIDEVDSVLIDEAKTPLIVAGKHRSSSELHFIASRLVGRFESDEHYNYDPETKATSLTDKGIELIEQSFDVGNLYELEHQTLYHYVIQALRAKVIFKRDVDYIVSDGKIMLVDIFTGRVMEGRSLSDGLHQAIEAKEGLEITDENKTQASITIQNYFRKYPALGGMTGTAKTDEKEFQEIYGMDVIQIPTNRPKVRVDHTDLVYFTKDDKYQAITNEVKNRHKTGQPILIGTTTILQSEEVATYLDKANLSYKLLNAKSVEQEIELIKQAGHKGKITIATNMAGRGTDIILGEHVSELGGLHVIGTEKHESRRVDDQLKGRSGRQGDPGSSQFFISLEDDMFSRFAKEELEKLTPKLSKDASGLVTSPKIIEFVNKIQLVVEGTNRTYRDYNLKLDDTINEQSKIVYEIRDQVLSQENQFVTLLPMISSAIEDILQRNADPDKLIEEWSLEQIQLELSDIVPLNNIKIQPIEDEDDLKIQLQEYYNKYKELLLEFEDNQDLQRKMKYIIVSRIDLNWIQHLENMIRLKEGIGLRSYQQEDPMRLYKFEGLELFRSMYKKIEQESSRQSAYLIKQELELNQPKEG